MSKKFIGSEGIKKIMDLGLKLFPNTEITSTEVNDMWNSLDKPAIEVGPESELDNWNYTLDEDKIILKQFTNTTAKNAIVYGAYEKDGKTYNTNVTSMHKMFYNCTNLKEIKGLENLDTSNVEYFDSMFNGCSSLTSLDLTSFDITSNAFSFEKMFYNCTNLKEIKVSRDKWVIEKGSVTLDMFTNCGCSEVTYVD